MIRPPSAGYPGGMRFASLMLLAPLFALGSCSGTVGDDLSAAEFAQYETVAFQISGMT